MASKNALVTLDASKLDPNNISELRQANFLVLTPSDQIAQINPFFAIRLSHVPVEFEVGDYNRVTSTHVWKVPGGGDYAPTKVLLNKIAAAAGIEWIPEECKRVDNQNDRKIVRYRAVGQMRLPSGEIKRFVDEATEDAYIVEEEILEKWLAKVDTEVDNWVNGKKAGKKRLSDLDCREAARKEFRQYFKFINERCMARAMNRAIRQVLALNGTYKLDELRKGFVVPQVNFSPDWSDPRVAALATEALGGKFAALFSGGVQAPQLAAPADVPALPAGPTADPLTGEVDGHPEVEDDLDRIMAGVDAPMLSAGEAGAIAEVAGAELERMADEVVSGATAVDVEVLPPEGEMPDLEAPPITPETLKSLAMHCNRVFGTGDDNEARARAAISAKIGRTIASRKALTEEEGVAMVKSLEKTPTGKYAPKAEG